MKWLINKIKKEIMKDIRDEIIQNIEKDIDKTVAEIQKNLDSEWAFTASKERLFESEEFLDGVVERLKKKQL